MNKLMMAAALVVSATAATPATPQQVDALGPMAAELRNRVGTWQVEARLQLQPGAAPITISARAESKLVGGRWLVTELRAADMDGPGFEGVGVNGYDAARGRYVGFWIDGTRGQAIAVEGDYDPAARVFRTTSQERSGDRTVAVVSETRTLGPDEEVTTFIATDAQGQPFERMRLHYRRVAS